MKNSTTTDVLKSLETLYTQSKYQEAIDLLLKNKGSFEPGVFHYNLGSLYLKQKDLAVARFHLEKAYHSGFQTQEVTNNLKVVESGLNLSTLEDSGNTLTDGFYQVIFAPNAYVVTYLLFFALFLVWVKKVKNLSWIWLSSLAILFLLPAAMKIWWNKDLNMAITLKGTQSKEGPSGIFENNHDLPAGVKLIVTKPKEGWYFIQHPSHLSGWVRHEDIGIM